jgi:hypothetical protein
MWSTQVRSRYLADNVMTKNKAVKKKAKVVLAASTGLMVGLLVGLPLSRSLASLSSEPLEQSAEGVTPRAHLPYASKERAGPTPTPTPPSGPVGLRVYDMYGDLRTYRWAVRKYGVHVEQVQGTAYHCVELREHSGPASIDVYVYNRRGQPAVGVPVEFHWPSGMDVKLTEASGKAGFAYGPGSWITDPSVGGPHWLIVSNESSCDLVSKLGMLAGTAHDHLDVTYRYGVLGE